MERVSRRVEKRVSRVMSRGRVVLVELVMVVGLERRECS